MSKKTAYGIGPYVNEWQGNVPPPAHIKMSWVILEHFQISGCVLQKLPSW